MHDLVDIFPEEPIDPRRRCEHANEFCKKLASLISKGVQKFLSVFPVAFKSFVKRDNRDNHCAVPILNRRICRNDPLMLSVDCIAVGLHDLRTALHDGRNLLRVHPGQRIYAAIGNSGNVIYVNPETNVVAGVSSYFKPTVFDRVDFIEEVLLPTIL